MTAQNQFLTTVTIDGKPHGEWESCTGGDPSSETGKYRPAGGAKQKARKGLREYSDVMVGREWERERDAVVERKLRPRVGRANATINRQPLDEDGLPFDKPTVFTGVLTGMSGGDTDANSSDGKRLELTFLVTEVS